MSHRKFEHPRQGHTGYMPKRRTVHHKGRVRHFPKDDAKKPVHLTAFMGYKAGMTHVVRYHERREGKKLIKKDIVEGATVVETPAMKIVGCVGYTQTPNGLRALTTVWAQNLSDEVKRRFYKNWVQSKKKAFTKYSAKWADEKSKKNPNKALARIKKYCQVVRVIAHTQLSKLNLRQKKAHVMEIQLNGGTIDAKVQWAKEHFEKEVTIGEVFADHEMVDTIGVTRGKGTQGVTKRSGVSRLPRKTHRGLRKVGCIGAWHPASVPWTVSRSGQLGYFHRTQLSNKIYRVGTGERRNAYCEADGIQKDITPMGGFPYYGVVKNDFLLIKGAIQGTRKRVITIRKALFVPTTNFANEKVDVKFIDTSSNIGHGKFQTFEEKDKFYGPLASKNKNV